jgi:hypothetical protein
VCYWKAAFCCAFFFFWYEKGLNAKDIHKEIVPIYGGQCLSRKAVHNWVANVSLKTKELKRRRGSGWVETTKDFYASGFDAIVKRWDKCISVGGGYLQK